jgi:hypothetical protein
MANSCGEQQAPRGNGYQVAGQLHRRRLLVPDSPQLHADNVGKNVDCRGGVKEPKTATDRGGSSRVIGNSGINPNMPADGLAATNGYVSPPGIMTRSGPSRAAPAAIRQRHRLRRVSKWESWRPLAASARFPLVASGRIRVAESLELVGSWQHLQGRHQFSKRHGGVLLHGHIVRSWRLPVPVKSVRSRTPSVPQPHYDRSCP